MPSPGPEVTAVSTVWFTPEIVQFVCYINHIFIGSSRAGRYRPHSTSSLITVFCYLHLCPASPPHLSSTSPHALALSSLALCKAFNYLWFSPRLALLIYNLDYWLRKGPWLQLTLWFITEHCKILEFSGIPTSLQIKHPPNIICILDMQLIFHNTIFVVCKMLLMHFETTRVRLLHLERSR